MSTTESQVRYFNRYVQGLVGGCDMFDFKDKSRNARIHMSYMLNRTQSMFKWENLPETIPERILELFLQINGNVCFYEYEGNLYVFTGGLGGEPDVYYMPTIYTIANPALKLSKSLKIGDECVVMPNDSLYCGLMPMFDKYATALTENELSLNIAMINTRIIDWISAGDDNTKKSAELFIRKIIDGDLSVIASNEFFEGIKAQPHGSSGMRTITQLIENEQYLKASWFNELGLNANYNMKRESLNTTESQLNNDALLPLVDDMLKNRRIAIEKVNKKYGTNITVSLNSSWEDNEIEIANEQGETLDDTETQPDEKEVIENADADTET